MNPGAVISSLWRYPVKGFTAESIDAAHLEKDDFFPFDRMFALEAGPSGFDAQAPETISKMKFAVLARFPSLAKFDTRYNELSGVLTATCDGQRARHFDLSHSEGRQAFARWVEIGLKQADNDYNQVLHPLNLLESQGLQGFRFTDSRHGYVSFLNKASWRNLCEKIGQKLDPLRLRANIWVDGWEAFADHDWVGRTLLTSEDGPQFEVLKPIVRCVATHVNPKTAIRDIDICSALWDNYGHRDCGIYARIIKSGTLRSGDRLQLA